MPRLGRWRPIVVACRFVFAISITTLVAACGGDAALSSGSGSDTGAAGEEVTRAGDLSLRVQAIQTDRLPEPVAAAYGVRRSRNDVLVLVALRQGADAVATSPAAEVKVTVSDLLGRSRAIAMRQIVSGDLVDHVGTLRATPPETLRIQVQARPANGEPLSLAITRDFLP